MKVPQKRAAIYLPTVDQLLVQNQRAALIRYATAMGWTVVADVGPDRRQVRALAAGGSIDVVLSWRMNDVPALAWLLSQCRVHHVEFLALAQSCAALAE
jgi:hypothetical protein